MSSVDLFVVKDKKLMTNIPPLFKRAGLKKLVTPYMELRSFDEHGYYNGFDIELMDINLEKGYAEFRAGTGNTDMTTFTIEYIHDPVAIFDEYDPGIEHHIFGEIINYEINQEIKPGRLYKFQKAFTHEWFLAVVQSVSPSHITLNELGAMRFKKSSSSPYRLYQKGDTFSIYTSNETLVERYKTYVVSEVCDIADMFTDKYCEEDDNNHEQENQKES